MVPDTLPSPISSSAPASSTASSPPTNQSTLPALPASSQTTAPDDDYSPSPVGPVFRRTRWGRVLHRTLYRHHAAPYTPSASAAPRPIDVPNSKPQCRKRGRPPKK